MMGRMRDVLILLRGFGGSKEAHTANIIRKWYMESELYTRYL